MLSANGDRGNPKLHSGASIASRQNIRGCSADSRISGYFLLDRAMGVAGSGPAHCCAAGPPPLRAMRARAT
jgi:hypothetical protein